MVGIAIDTQAARGAQLEVAQAEAPEFEKVTWYRDPGLRKLYFWCTILCVASATTGYDGYDEPSPIIPLDGYHLLTMDIACY